MAETIEIDINARDNTGKATKSVADNFRNLGRQISGIGSSMSNIFTRPLMDLERFLMKNSEVQAALEPARKAWSDLGNELAVSLVPVIKDLTPALISLAGSLSDVIKWFSALPPGTKDAIVAFVGIMGALGPVLIGVGQLVTFLGSLSGAWATLSGILAPLGTTVLPAIGAGLAAISAPVWLLIGAIALLGVTIAVFGKQAWQTIQDIGGIFSALWTLIQIKIEQIKQAFLSVDWGGIGRNIINGIANGIRSISLSGLIGGAIGGINKRANGGFTSGLTLVGERGPELVNLPAGSYVNSNSASKRMARNSSGGVIINYSPTMSLASEYEFRTKFAPLILEAVRGKV